MLARWFLRGVATLLVTSAGALFAASATSFNEKLATPADIRALQTGGYVLYMRHSNTDTTKLDRTPQVDLDDCNSQRPLSGEGRELAARVGQVIRNIGIPLGEILVSPMCRTKETALLAFGEHFIVNTKLMYTGNLTTREKTQHKDLLKELLSRPVPSGTNRVIVAHAPNLMDVMGYLPQPEGIVVIIRPRGHNGFEYIASIPPDRWQALTQ